MRREHHGQNMVRPRPLGMKVDQVSELRNAIDRATCNVLRRGDESFRVRGVRKPGGKTLVKLPGTDSDPLLLTNEDRERFLTLYEPPE